VLQEQRSHGVRGTRAASEEHLTERQESTLLCDLRSGATCENGGPHSGSLHFADTEGVTGSNPVAPTRMGLTRALVDWRVVLGVGIGGEAGYSGRRALPYLSPGQSNGVMLISRLCRPIA
jgi:hypothetical protein